MADQRRKRVRDNVVPRETIKRTILDEYVSALHK